MRAYAFVRYHSGDGAGHVGWGFELPDGRVCCGSVENHSGHLFTPASQMGFWCACTEKFADEFTKRGYNDVCVYEVTSPNPGDARRVTVWIERLAYRAIMRNCEDDVYDVLRMYGVDGLEAPFFNWFPRLWFTRLRGEKMGIEELNPSVPRGPSIPQDDTRAQHDDPEPLRPEWRKPWHPSHHLLNVAKVFRRPSLPRGPSIPQDDT